MAAIVADIERFVAFGRRGIMNLLELIRIGVVAGTCGIFLKGAYCSFRLMCLSKCGGHTNQQCWDNV